MPWVIVGIAVVVIAGVAAAAILLTGREAPRPSPGPPAPVAPRPSPPPEPVKPPSDEAPSAAPGLNAIEVKRKLDEAKPQLQACIDEALKRDPKLKVAGRIRISTTIAPSGAVTSATIDNKTVDASPLGACLKRTTQHIVFPAFSGDPFEVDIPISVSAG